MIPNTRIIELWRSRVAGWDFADMESNIVAFAGDVVKEAAKQLPMSGDQIAAERAEFEKWSDSADHDGLLRPLPISTWLAAKEQAHTERGVRLKCGDSHG